MITVIIPTLNDAERLPQTLAPLVEGVAHGIIRQVIVADGGSADETRAMAEAAGCDVVVSEAGRGKQIRAAVPSTKGKFLFFLNPGVVLKPAWISETEIFCHSLQSRAHAAAYRLAFDDTSPEAKRALFWARLRARITSLPFSDQGVLMSRFFYDGLGGYPDLPRMADIEFARRIGAKRWALFQTEAVTSAAKFRDDRGALHHVSLIVRHLLGGDPVELAKTYERGSREAVRASSGV
jgi:glycosyltransferase involved in cell wall biosynthesis